MGGYTLNAYQNSVVGEFLSIFGVFLSNLTRLHSFRSWRIAKRLCHGNSHEYSNKWSLTMDLPSDCLRYGVNLPDGPSMEHSISWLVRGGPRVLNPSIGKGEYSLLPCNVRSGRWGATCCPVETRGRCLNQIYRTGLGGWENYESRHSGRAPEP